MKKLFFLLIIFSSLSSFAQNKSYIVVLDKTPIQIQNRRFYVEKVIDKRKINYSIGFVQVGAFNVVKQANFTDPLEIALQKYFNSVIPPKNSLTPVTVVINELKISEETNFSSEYGYATISADFYIEDSLVFSSTHKAESQGADVTKYHPAIIRKAFVSIFEEFNNADWKSKNSLTPMQTNTSESTDTIFITSSSKPERTTYTSPPRNEINNLRTIGYQIGGFNLIGYDFEFRLNNILGFHMGIGLVGATLGFKMHTQPYATSPFVNLSWKNAGFGFMNTFGAEFGYILRFNQETNTGLLAQLGLAKITSIQDAYAQTVFSSTDVPEFILTLGVGICW